MMAFFASCIRDLMIIVNPVSRTKVPAQMTPAAEMLPLSTTENGSRLYATAFKRTTHWEKTGRGRRLHDLRHTAACLWLEAGVSPTTVQAWLGHADLTTTQRYLHYLGTSADETALQRLNQWGDAGGTRAHTDRDGNE